VLKETAPFVEINNQNGIPPGWAKRNGGVDEIQECFSIADIREWVIIS